MSAHCAHLRRVTAAELARRFSAMSDMALHEPLVVTKNGRDRLVMLGLDEYNHLRDLVTDGQSETGREGSELSEAPPADTAKEPY